MVGSPAKHISRNYYQFRKWQTFGENKGGVWIVKCLQIFQSSVVNERSSSHCYVLGFSSHNSWNWSCFNSFQSRQQWPDPYKAHSQNCKKQLLASPCLSTLNNWAPPERFSWNLIYEHFTTICQENSRSIEIRKE